MHRNNHCFIVGNLGADPVVRAKSEKSGAIVGFSIAENVQAFDQESHAYKTVHTNWFQVTAFGPTGERVKAGLKKGDRVAIQGRLKSSKYTDKAGKEHAAFEIIADEVTLWHPLPALKGAERAVEEALPF